MRRLFVLKLLSSAFGVLPLLLVVGVVGPARAFDVKPGAQIVRGKAGSTVKAYFEIVNDTHTPRNFIVEIKDSYLLPENKGLSVNEWLYPELKDVRVPAQGSRKITFQVKIPQKAVGELAAYVSFTPKTADTLPKEPVPIQQGIPIKITTLVTASLYVQIKGTEISQADLGDIRVRNIPEIPNHSPVIEAGILIKNTGNIQQRPGVHFTLKDTSTGKTAAELDSPIGGAPVFGHQDLFYTAKTTGTLKAGMYEAEAVVRFTPEVSAVKKTAFTLTPSGEATDYKEVP